MSEPTAGDNTREVGENPISLPPSTTAVNNSGDGAALAPPTLNNATSPMDVNPNDDVAKDVPAPLEIIPPHKERGEQTTPDAAIEAVPVASASTDKSPPRDQDVVAQLAATAPPTVATMKDNSAPAMKDNISSNGIVASIITQPTTDNNTNIAAAVAAAAAAAVNSSARNSSPMNILAAIASVESPTGEEHLNQKNDDFETQDAGVITTESLLRNDIILSLKDSTYKTIMYQYFRKLDDNMKDGVRDEMEERKTKDEVYNLLNNAGGRLLNYADYRRPNLGFIQVSEVTARTSE